MACEIEVLFTPAEYRGLGQRDLTRSACVVFDVLRATSTIVTALANGANAVIPVLDIPEALGLRHNDSSLLLAGERNGLRIGAELTGGVEFDLGNSPRECTPDKISGRTIVSTTTNGTRALRACRGANIVLATSFLNLAATADYLVRQSTPRVLLVCAGTGEDTALEDALAAGALCAILRQRLPDAVMLDSAVIALTAFEWVGSDLPSAFQQSRNARRLLSIDELKEDVAFCWQTDRFPIVASLSSDGAIRSVR